MMCVELIEKRPPFFVGPETALFCPEGTTTGSHLESF
jgi:hypothetical protein